MNKLLIASAILSLTPIQALAGENGGEKLKEIISKIASPGDRLNQQDANLLAERLHAFLKEKRLADLEGSKSNIPLANKAARQLLISASKQSGEIRNSYLAAVESYIEELDSNIDASWDFPLVSANVAPPPGTTNAMAGMNPDAIKDPDLRRKYLDAIAENERKNLKNSQQLGLANSRDSILRAIAGLTKEDGAKEGWTKKEALERFGKKKEAKALLEKYTS